MCIVVGHWIDEGRHNCLVGTCRAAIYVVSRRMGVTGSTSKIVLLE